jgi:hypothetical protein
MTTIKHCWFMSKFKFNCSTQTRSIHFKTIPARPKRFYETLPSFVLHLFGNSKSAKSQLSLSSERAGRKTQARLGVNEGLPRSVWRNMDFVMELATNQVVDGRLHEGVSDNDHRRISGVEVYSGRLFQ